MRAALARVLSPVLALAPALTAVLALTAPASAPGITRAAADPADFLPGLAAAEHTAPAGPEAIAPAPATHLVSRHLPDPAARRAEPHYRLHRTLAPRTGMITLSAGDTLSGLALSYGTTVRALQELNGLGTSTLIYADASFRVPAAAGTVSVVRHRAATLHTVHRAVRSAQAGSGAAATAIAFARAQLGKPYVWGGTGPDGFDCSGLVMRAWQAAGVSLPRTTYDQVSAGTPITRDELAPGDLIFSSGDGHVQLYIGGGQVIQAPYTGANVEISPLPDAATVDAYVRISP